MASAYNVFANPSPDRVPLTNNSAYTSNFDYLSSPAYQYSYQFGDWLSGGMAAGRQAEGQAALDAKEWQRNEYSAQQQRAFEEYMDSTKTQRAMADIQAAGLNPWLALQTAGLGGAVPNGAAASSSAGQVASGKSGSDMLGGLGAAAAGIAMLFRTIAKIVK